MSPAWKEEAQVYKLAQANFLACRKMGLILKALKTMITFTCMDELCLAMPLFNIDSLMCLPTSECGWCYYSYLFTLMLGLGSSIVKNYRSSLFCLVEAYDMICTGGTMDTLQYYCCFLLFGNNRYIIIHKKFNLWHACRRS